MRRSELHLHVPTTLWSFSSVFLYSIQALGMLTLMLQTQTGKNRFARVIARHLRPCSEQDLTRTVKYASTCPRLREATCVSPWRVFPRCRFAALGLTRIFHESSTGTVDMAVLQGVLEPRTLRRTVQVRLGSEPLRLAGGTPICKVSLRQFMKYAG